MKWALRYQVNRRKRQYLAGDLMFPRLTSNEDEAVAFTTKKDALMGLFLVPVTLSAVCEPEKITCKNPTKRKSKK